jgi:hypothetical protein
MSERSELQQHGACFAAKRRRGHWCPVMSPTVKWRNGWMVHQ